MMSQNFFIVIGLIPITMQNFKKTIAPRDLQDLAKLVQEVGKKGRI